MRNDSCISSRNPRPTSSCSFHIDRKCPSDLRSSEASPDRLLCLSLACYMSNGQFTRWTPFTPQDQPGYPGTPKIGGVKRWSPRRWRRSGIYTSSAGLSGLTGNAARSVILVIPFFGTKSNSYSIILTIIELCWPRYEVLTRPFVNWQDSC